MEKLGKVVVVGIMVVLIGIVSGYLYYYPTTGIIGTHKTIEPIDYMQNLPTKPNDWDIIMRELDSGYIDILELDKAYWIQPDFYPSWRHAQKFYTEHDYSRWGVYGHGAYPANPTVTFKKTSIGTWIQDSVLFKTGYGIETWQGLRLVAENSEYFDVEIEPNEFLLEPTFPVFSEDWVKKLSYTVTIKKEPPKGIYAVRVFAISPSEEKSEEWFWEVLKKESRPEEQEMITRAKLQAYAEGKTPEEFANWVEVGRKNKYVDGTTFQASERMRIEIVVE